MILSLKTIFFKACGSKYKYLRDLFDKILLVWCSKKPKQRKSHSIIYLSLQNWLYSTNFANSNKKDSGLIKQSKVKSTRSSKGKICAVRVPDIIFDQFCRKSVMPSLRWQAKVRSLSPTDSQTSKEFLALPTNYNFSPVLTRTTLHSLYLLGQS